jgi:hypothetical protein
MWVVVRVGWELFLSSLELKGMFSRGITSKKSGVKNNQSVLDD